MNIFKLAVLFSYWVYTKDNELPMNTAVLYSHERFSIIIDYTSNTCFSVHRGTYSLDDLINDIESEFPTPSSFHGKLVNEHFLASFMEYRDIHYAALWIVSLLNDCRWVFTGHSLGGSSASMASMDFNTSDPTLITFGAPAFMISNSSLSTGKCHRFVHMSNKGVDPIPSLPTSSKSTHPPCHVIGVHTSGNTTVKTSQWPHGETPRFCDITLHKAKSYVQSIINMKLCDV